MTTRLTADEWIHELRKPNRRYTLEELQTLNLIGSLERLEILKRMVDHLIGLAQGQVPPVVPNGSAPAQPPPVAAVPAEAGERAG